MDRPSIDGLGNAVFGEHPLHVGPPVAAPGPSLADRRALAAVVALRTERQEQGVEVSEIMSQYCEMKQLSVTDPEGYDLVFQESVR